jgi:LacI family transcriptional regulator
MIKRVTSLDVAKLAGVSRTTVSFVLNNVSGMRISQETRQRVISAAEQLDYHPNASARHLVTGQTRILAYVERQSPERAFADAFLPKLLRGVHDAASISGYEVLFAPIPLDNSKDRCARLLRGGHVDGVIISGPRTDDNDFRALLSSDAPIVLQGQWPEVTVASVDVDNFKAAKDATKHLIKLGHRRLGIILHAPLVFTAVGARLRGFQAALADHGLPFTSKQMAVADFSPASGELAMEDMLKSGFVPTAVFATSDTVAIGAMKTARLRGLKIPDDIAFVGFDDIPMAVYNCPPLTTIRLPAYGLGWAAADLLVRLIASDEFHETNEILDTELIIRSSSKASNKSQLGSPSEC